MQEQIAGNPTEDPFPEPCMAVATRHNEVRIHLFGNKKQLIGDGSLALRSDFCFRDHIVPLQIGDDAVYPCHGGIKVRFLSDLNHMDAFGSFQKRQGVPHGPAPLTRVFPSDQDALCLESTCSRRHHEQGASQAHQDVSGIGSLGRIAADPLQVTPHDHDVGGTRLSGDEIGRPLDGRAPFSRQTLAGGTPCEIGRRQRSDPP